MVQKTTGKYLNPDEAVANRNVKGNPGKNRKAEAWLYARTDVRDLTTFHTPNAGREKIAQTKVIKSPKIKLPAAKKRNSGGR